ncbi:hypothetical protein [Nitrobacter winogradskyi]|uniref:hypothetical protein n=1 Tax=Nitrobacter winogradskyi TaxID=913 RepID=UPI0011D073C1|nr:hypothetical protein [Nitrobacter winogradskyi]
MGRPIGSVNREKPVSDLLRVAVLSGGGRRLRVILEKLIDKAEQGDLQAIREIMDRLDGKPVQAIERSDARPLRQMSDRELFEIIQGGPAEPAAEPSYPRICGPSQAKRTTK